MTSNPEPDYYAVLGLNESATERDIVNAYRKRAKETHPDKNPNDPNANENFRKVKEAYDFLMDSTKRKYYDEKRARAKREREREANFKEEVMAENNISILK